MALRWVFEVVVLGKDDEFFLSGEHSGPCSVGVGHVVEDVSWRVTQDLACLLYTSDAADES